VYSIMNDTPKATSEIQEIQACAGLEPVRDRHRAAIGGRANIGKSQNCQRKEISDAARRGRGPAR
jgi:hypothetical protein